MRKSFQEHLIAKFTFLSLFDLQVRVVMNKEPKHFLKIFGGKLIIFMVIIKFTSFSVSMK